MFRLILSDVRLPASVCIIIIRKAVSLVVLNTFKSYVFLKMEMGNFLEFVFNWYVPPPL